VVGLAVLAAVEITRRFRTPPLKTMYAVLFGGLIVGGYSVQTIGMPSSISDMIQGAILFFLIAGDMIAKFRLRRG